MRSMDVRVERTVRLVAVAIALELLTAALCLHSEVQRWRIHLARCTRTRPTPKGMIRFHLRTAVTAMNEVRQLRTQLLCCTHLAWARNCRQRSL